MNVHVLVAASVNADGHREILGVEVTSSQDGAGWPAFLRGLVARGLTGVQLVISDAHRGLVEAIGSTLPGAAWQRCRTHYLRNLLTKVSKSTQPWVATLARIIFGQPAAQGQLSMPGWSTGCRPSTPRRRRAPRPGQKRSACLHRVPAAGVAADLVEPSPRTAEQRNPAPHRRGRHLPRPDRDRPPRGTVVMEQTDEWTKARRCMGLEFPSQARLTSHQGHHTRPHHRPARTHRLTCNNRTTRTCSYTTSPDVTSARRER
ncbi:transposase [Actinomadura rudentiformis]